MQQSKRLPLGGGHVIFVSRRHTFGTDALLLAHFAAPKISDQVCDLGTGCGILPLLWRRDQAVGTPIDAVDIQADACALLGRSLLENSWEGRVRPICEDLKDLSLPAGMYSLVTCNPPYRRPDSGKLCEDEGKNIARFELCCTIYDAAKSAGRLLKTGGRFCLCHLPERLTDCVQAMREAGIEPKRLRLVEQQAGAAPWLLLLEGIKGRQNGLKLLPSLTLRKTDGTATEEARKIYAGFDL